MSTVPVPGNRSEDWETELTHQDTNKDYDTYSTKNRAAALDSEDEAARFVTPCIPNPLQRTKLGFWLGTFDKKFSLNRDWEFLQHREWCNFHHSEVWHSATSR